MYLYKLGILFVIIFCHISDEEIGGTLGMAHFVKTNVFQSLNIGFALDEGLASIDDIIPLYYGERTILRQYLFFIIKKYNKQYLQFTHFIVQ